MHWFTCIGLGGYVLPGLTLISRRRGSKMMDLSVSRSRRNYSFIASVVGGALVCFDYATFLGVIATLPAGDSSGAAALPWVLIGLVCGLAMIASAYLGRSSTDRKWPYTLLGASLITLFLPLISVLSALGAVLGSAASTYILSKRRMQPSVKSA